MVVTEHREGKVIAMMEERDLRIKLEISAYSFSLAELEVQWTLGGHTL